MKKKYYHLFGPVPSRRFGRSLGIDLTPCKTCSLDCVFCQLGRTKDKTINRQEYIATSKIIDELEQWLHEGGNADYITLSGSGEPILHSHFGKILKFIKQNTKIPAVLLTNGTMMHLPEVREQASAADIVKVSLSAWDQASFYWVNRPYPLLKFDQLIEGQKIFRNHFKGQLWLEVFLLKGINSSYDNVRKIAKFAKQIGPDRIQLNTVVRPPSENFAAPLTTKEMDRLTNLFTPKAEIITRFIDNGSIKIEANEDTILSILKRRPCTAENLAKAFGMHVNDVYKYLGILIGENQIKLIRENDTMYFKIDKNTIIEQQTMNLNH